MRIATYARVSTREQRDGRTIESQVKALEVEVERRKAALIKHYEDDGLSGSTLQRPGLDRLRDDAARGRFDAVLVYSVDRLSRDSANLAVITRDFERRGIKLIFLNVPEASGPEARMIVGVLGQFAEFERLLIRDRARRGRRFKVEERGLVAGTQAPFGYTYVKQDKANGVEGRYELNPAEARVVRMIFDWVTDERRIGNSISPDSLPDGLQGWRGGLGDGARGC